MKCPRCGTEMNQGVYAVLPPIPYVDCPKCGYHKEGDDVYKESMTNHTITDMDVGPLVKSVDDLRKQLNVARTDINDLTIKVSTLEADLKRLKGSTRAKFENVVEQVGELRERCDGPKLTILSAESHEKAKEDLLKALEESNAVPIIDLPKPIRYVYIIRERTDEGWDIVGNVCYPTFNDANEKMKKLIKDYRQLDPDYKANNLNIIQVRLE